MNVKKTAGSVGKFILKRLTPIPTLKRQGGEILGSITRTKQALKEAREAVHQTAPTPEEIQQAKALERLDAYQKFESIVAARGWTDWNLRLQWSSIHWARRAYLYVSLLLTVVGVTGYLAMVSSMNTVSTLILALVLLVCFPVFVLKAMQQALFQWQIERRAFLPLREFLSQPDLFKRIFL